MALGSSATYGVTSVDQLGQLLPPVQIIIAPKVGVSANGTVATTSGVLLTAGMFGSCFTIQNTSATQNISISFNTATPNDIKIIPGGSYVSTIGNTNALNAIASAAGATYAVIGA